MEKSLFDDLVPRFQVETIFKESLFFVLLIDKPFFLKSQNVSAIGCELLKDHNEK
jgi:hypothetical protein